MQEVEYIININVEELLNIADHVFIRRTPPPFDALQCSSNLRPQ